MARYLHARRVALTNQANAYGFTLVVGCTGALVIGRLGKPDPADVFAYLGDALVAISLIVAVVFVVWQPFEEFGPPRRQFSAIHIASAPAAAAAGWSLTSALDGDGGSFVAVGIYQLLLDAEVALAIVPRHRRTMR